MSEQTCVGDCLNIGAFTEVFPIKTVKAVLKQTGKKSIRERMMPNHLVVYYVMGMALMMTQGYQEVLRWLLEGSRSVTGLKSKGRPLGKSGISQARERLGFEPFKRLYEQEVQPIATEKTKGAWFEKWRLVTIDGSTLDVADTPANEREFGLSRSDRGSSAFPKVRLVSLIENGTRVLFGMEFGAFETTSEMDLAWKVVRKLKRGMLCLADRYYFGYQLWKEASKAGAELLWRVKSNQILPPHKVFEDGSYLSWIYASTSDRQKGRDGILVRVIEYKFKWVRSAESTYRLATTILDPEMAPAEKLAALYHDRWEIETALGECKSVLKGANIVFRSKTPALVRQELYGFMLTYFVIRSLMHQAALQEDEDPDRISFKHTVQVIKRKIHLFRVFPPAAMA
jgi:hypothetical protein